jgi:hypothetical protein
MEALEAACEKATELHPQLPSASQLKRDTLRESKRLAMEQAQAEAEDRRRKSEAAFVGAAASPAVDAINAAWAAEDRADGRNPDDRTPHAIAVARMALCSRIMDVGADAVAVELGPDVV